MRKIVQMFVLSLLLSAIAAQANAQDAIKLEYKFTPGELLRYKMVMDMNVAMNMNSQEGMSGGQIPAFNGQIVMVMRQRAKKILANGDAEIAFAYESIKAPSLGSEGTIAVDKLPVVTMVMSKDGIVKSVKGVTNPILPMGQMPMMDMPSLYQFGGSLPANSVKVGDTWTQNIANPTSPGGIKVDGKLLSTDTKLDGVPVAVLKQDVSGNLNLNMPIPTPPEGGSAAPSMSMTGNISSTGNVYFSPEKGRMMQMDGNGNARINMSFPGVEEGQSGAMNIDVQLKYVMSLLPPEGK
jgi:hypothetical protein